MTPLILLFGATVGAAAAVAMRDRGHRTGTALLAGFAAALAAEALPLLLAGWLP